MDHELAGVKAFMWSLARRVAKGKLDPSELKVEKARFQQVHPCMHERYCLWQLMCLVASRVHGQMLIQCCRHQVLGREGVPNY